MRGAVIDRRGFCAALAAAASAVTGCVDPDSVLTMDAVDDQGIAERAATGLSPTEMEVVAEAVENGSATTTDVTLPYDGGRPVEHEGSYYTVETVEVGEQTVTRYTVAVSAPEQDGGYTAVEFDELPEVDREKLEGTFRVNAEREREVRAETSYNEDEAESSVLVPQEEYDAVRRDDTVLTLDVGGPEETTVDEVRYDVELLAETAEELASWTRDSYLWELSDLTTGEREIVDEAVDSGYYETGVAGDFRSLAERFEDRPAVEKTDWGGEYLVDYRGSTYWTELRRPPSAV